MCDISIIKVSGNDPGLDSITVIGNVQRCSSGIEREPPLIVQITCPTETVALFAPNLPFQGTVIDASSIFIGSNGDFFATFDDVGDCRCGGQMLVTAQCATHEDCRAELVVDALECVDCPEERQNIDDVSKGPECESGATALVTLTSTFVNTTSGPVLFQIETGHPDGEIVSGGTTSLNAGESGTVTAVVRYPTLSFPQPYVVALDLQGAFLGCPPWPIQLAQIPACCPDVEITNVEVDGCQVVVNVEPINVPQRCKYVWNFDCKNIDGVGVWEEGPFSQRVHQYEKEGEYEICVYVRCGSCNGLEAKTEVEITECRDEDEPWVCGLYRTVSVVAAALAIVALVLIKCIPKAAPALLLAAAIAAVVSALAGLVYFFSDKCKRKPCNLALLISGQGMLGGGSALIIFSKCCPWVLWSGLGISLAGLGLLFLWKSQCEATDCRLAEYVGFVFATILPAISSAVAFIPLLRDCYSWWAFAGLMIFYSYWFVEVVKCKND